eukprot:scaffold8177_cov106-Cylindrotheca_fusiformis.AAC.1
MLIESGWRLALCEDSLPSSGGGGGWLKSRVVQRSSGGGFFSPGCLLQYGLVGSVRGDWNALYRPTGTIRLSRENPLSMTTAPSSSKKTSW